MYGIIRSLAVDDDGAILAEYGLLVVLIAIAAVTAVRLFGISVFDLYDGFPFNLFN